MVFIIPLGRLMCPACRTGAGGEVIELLRTAPLSGLHRHVGGRTDSSVNAASNRRL